MLIVAQCSAIPQQDTRSIFSALGAKVSDDFPGAGRRAKKRKQNMAPSMADINKMAAAFAAATGLGFNDGLTPAQRAAQRARLGISEEQPVAVPRNT